MKKRPVQWILIVLAAVCILFAGITCVRAMKQACLLYTSPSPRDKRGSRMPSSA